MLPSGFRFADKYDIRGVLGAGVGGEAYEAWDSIEEDTVALKLLKPSGHAMGTWAEAVILRRLTDHHILPIRNAAEWFGQPYLVTTLATHGSVNDVIKAQPLGLSADEAVSWLRQACQGVARGHDQALVHNDIKPDNLFLNDKRECVVADWGAAGQIDATTGTAPVYAATHTTVAPEVAAVWSTGAPVSTVASDVYSLGATAFTMLSGTTPHDFSSPTAAADPMLAVATTARRRLLHVAPHVPRWIADRVERALNTDPDKRWSDPLAFAAALGQRPAATRRWRRTDEHASHEGCWRGTPVRNGSEYVLCMEVGANAGRRDLTASSAASGNRISRGCRSVTRADWANGVRKSITDLG